MNSELKNMLMGAIQFWRGEEFSVSEDADNRDVIQIAEGWLNARQGKAIKSGFKMRNTYFEEESKKALLSYAKCPDLLDGFSMGVKLSRKHGDENFIEIVRGFAKKSTNYPMPDAIAFASRGAMSAWIDESLTISSEYSEIISMQEFNAMFDEGK